MPEDGSAVGEIEQVGEAQTGEAASKQTPVPSTLTSGHGQRTLPPDPHFAAPNGLDTETRRGRLWEAAAARGVPILTILAAVGIVVLVYLAGRLVYKLREIILLFVVAGFVALLLNPAVSFLQRHVARRRGGAVAIVTVIALLVFGGLAFAFGYPLVNGITHLAHELPTYVRQAEHGKGWIGRLVRKYHVQKWVTTNLEPKLTSFAKNLSKPALTLGKGALSLVIALLTIFILVLLLLLEGPKMRRGVLQMMSSQRSVTVTRIAEEVSRSVTGYMLGNFITSIIAGVVVYVTLLVMGVPFALLWGLWVAILDFLPMVGGAIAGIPTVLFAVGHSLTAGIVVLVVFLVYTQIENHILNPIVMSRTVKVNPLLVLVAILVGASVGDLVGGFFGGFVGTLLAIPVAGSIQVIVREAWQATAPESETAVPGTRGPSAAGPAATIGAAAAAASASDEGMSGGRTADALSGDDHPTGDRTTTGEGENADTNIDGGIAATPRDATSVT